MARKGLTGNDEAVSEIVGELMALVITVMIFGLLVVAVNAMMTRPHTEIVTISAASNGSVISLAHMGGDSVPFGNLAIIVNGNTVPFSARDADSNGDGLWEIGETLYVPDPAGQELDAIVYDSSSMAALGSFKLR